MLETPGARMHQMEVSRTWALRISILFRLMSLAIKTTFAPDPEICDPIGLWPIGQGELLIYQW